MNKLTKLGLATLAGSLVASSAYAGATVTGKAKIEYKSQDDDEVTGNPLTIDRGLVFAASGDLDNGMTAGYHQKLSAGAHTSSEAFLDMGDAGKIAVANGRSGAGIRAYRYVLPTAGEEAWDDVDTDDNGLVQGGDTGALYYTGSFGAVGVSIASQKDDATDSSWVLTYDGLVDGLMVGYGQGENGETTDLMTAFAKYTVGSITAAYQVSEIDTTGTTSDEEATGFGVSFAVNENMSISYNLWDVDMQTGTDEESAGLSASYSMGGMSFGLVSNSTDNVAGSSGDNDTFTEMNVTFAF